INGSAPAPPPPHLNFSPHPPPLSHFQQLVSLCASILQGDTDAEMIDVTQMSMYLELTVSSN
ncbi:hypothetical protein Bpfe_016337, partial [Biomphalaria pfeifferi]